MDGFRKWAGSFFQGIYFSVNLDHYTSPFSFSVLSNIPSVSSKIEPRVVVILKSR